MTGKPTLLILLALLGAGTARADGVRRFGIMVDAGVPDGANGSLVFRPIRWVRLSAGGGSNLVSPGVRGGASLLLGPISFSAEAGHYFRGDANPLARKISGDASLDIPALRSVGYDYANLHAGIEFGGDVFTFYIHGGMSYIWGDIKNAGDTANQSISSDGMFTFAVDPRVRAWAVSARVGLIFYVLP